MIDPCDFPVLLSFATTTPGITYSTPKTILTKGKKKKSNHTSSSHPLSASSKKKLVSVELFLLPTVCSTRPRYSSLNTPVHAWRAVTGRWEKRTSQTIFVTQLGQRVTYQAEDQETGTEPKIKCQSKSEQDSTFFPLLLPSRIGSLPAN